MVEIPSKRTPTEIQPSSVPQSRKIEQLISSRKSPSAASDNSDVNFKTFETVSDLEDSDDSGSNSKKSRSSTVSDLDRNVSPLPVSFGISQERLNSSLSKSSFNSEEAGVSSYSTEENSEEGLYAPREDVQFDTEEGEAEKGLIAVGVGKW